MKKQRDKIAVYLDADVKAALERHCFDNSIKVSRFIENMVLRVLREQKKIPDTEQKNFD